MKSIINRKMIISRHDTEVINITDEIKDTVKQSNIKKTYSAC